MRKVGFCPVLLAVAALAAGGCGGLGGGGKDSKHPGGVLEIAEGVWFIGRSSAPATPVAFCSVMKTGDDSYTELWLVQGGLDFPLREPSYIFTRVVGQDTGLGRPEFCAQFAGQLQLDPPPRFFRHEVTQTLEQPCQ